MLRYKPVHYQLRFQQRHHVSNHESHVLQRQLPDEQASEKGLSLLYFEFVPKGQASVVSRVVILLEYGQYQRYVQ